VEIQDNDLYIAMTRTEISSHLVKLSDELSKLISEFVLLKDDLEDVLQLNKTNPFSLIGQKVGHNLQQIDNMFNTVKRDINHLGDRHRRWWEEIESV